MEDNNLKPGDYVLNMYETTTLNKLIIFTSHGNYIYVPIHELPFSKWKDLGKHVNNLVVLHPDDKVVGAFIVNENSFFPPAEFSAGSKVASENNLQKQHATILHIRIMSGSPLQ